MNLILNFFPSSEEKIVICLQKNHEIFSTNLQSIESYFKVDTWILRIWSFWQEMQNRQRIFSEMIKNRIKTFKVSSFDSKNKLKFIGLIWMEISLLSNEQITLQYSFSEGPFKNRIQPFWAKDDKILERNMFSGWEKFFCFVGWKNSNEIWGRQWGEN